MDVWESTYRRKLSTLFQTEPTHPRDLKGFKFQLEDFPAGYQFFLMEKIQATTDESEEPKRRKKTTTGILYGYGIGRMSFHDPDSFLPHLLWLLTDPYRDFSRCACDSCFRSCSSIIKRNLPTNYPYFRAGELILVHIRIERTKLAGGRNTWKVMLISDPSVKAVSELTNTASENYSVPSSTLHDNYASYAKEPPQIVSSFKRIAFWPAIIEKRFLVWKYIQESQKQVTPRRWLSSYEYEVTLLNTEQAPGMDYVFRHQRFRRVPESVLLPYHPNFLPKLAWSVEESSEQNEKELLASQIMVQYDKALEVMKENANSYRLVSIDNFNHVFSTLWLGTELIQPGDLVRVDQRHLKKYEARESLYDLPRELEHTTYLKVECIYEEEEVDANGNEKRSVYLSGHLLQPFIDKNMQWKLKPFSCLLNHVRVPLQYVAGRFYSRFILLPLTERSVTYRENLRSTFMPKLESEIRQSMNVLDADGNSDFMTLEDPKPQQIVLPTFANSEPAIYAKRIMQFLDYPAALSTTPGEF